MANIFDRHSSLYNSWCGAKARCRNPNNRDYKNYGARGVTFWDGWNRFEDFAIWAIANGYKEGLTLERIDVNGNYCPENCRWIPLSEQALNRRNSKFIEVNGKEMLQEQWSRETGIPTSTIAYWLKKHGEEETARRLSLSLSNDLVYQPFPRKKEIFCIETQSIYSSMREACKDLGIERKTASKYLDTGEKYKGYTLYSYDSECSSTETRIVPRNKNKERMRYLTVNGICKLEKEWNDIIHAPSRTVARWRRNHGEEYASYRIEQALENGYVYKNYSQGHTVAVRHIESGLTFASIREAAKHFSVSPCSISNSIKFKRATRVGTFHKIAI